RNLREDERFEKLPILAMTANATMEDKRKTKEVGMNDHISKPIDPQGLFEALLKWVEHGERDLPKISDEPKVEGPQDAGLPDLPGIDTESGLARLGGNVRSYTKLLGKFVGNQAGAIAEIRTALAESDGERAVRAA
ncbi:unnamed protein product, partial [marine sediment metagenome]